MKSKSMNQRKNLVFLPEIEIWHRPIRSQDLTQAEFDHLFRGYWIRSDTALYSLLVLKGCKFLPLDYDIRS